ncbi:hypothetical protein LTR36_006642 [Oleoguttula mirabilis]|uniref:Uncharacterized protein n=1 Tax=Oleoguttula mirabilis TaxID=1507867 RepID=A0AAV9JBS0_9PEZI|nr:hypothetical protein LTR36_006642 [Oleoguttula mirabilis]
MPLRSHSHRPTPPSTGESITPTNLDSELPLTPANSETSRCASFGLYTGDLADAINFTEAHTPLLDAVDEHLKHYEDSLSAVSESEEEGDEKPASDSEKYYKHQLRTDQHANLPESRSVVQFRAGHHRSSSAPVKPLKSALAKSPPGSPPEYEGAILKKKKIRFADDPSSSDLSLRRRMTAPENTIAAALSTPFQQSDRQIGARVPWYGDDDESGRSFDLYSTAMNANMLGVLDNALIAEAEHAAAEMAEDALAAETDDAEDRVDSTVDQGDHELSSQDSTSDIGQTKDAAEDEAEGIANQDDLEHSLQDSASDIDQIEDTAEDDADSTVERDDLEHSLQGSLSDIDQTEDAAGEDDTGRFDASDGDTDKDDADSVDGDQDDTVEDEAMSIASVTADDDSQDEARFSTPMQAPNESDPLFLMELEPSVSPIGRPTDQREDDIDCELKPLPMIRETEVLVSAPAPRRTPPPPKAPNLRRLSDPYTRGRCDSPIMSARRRASSMTDFQKVHPLNLYPLKASPAECAVTACTVRASEQPKVITVYQHPAARYKQGAQKPTQTIQTVCSGSSTYQMLWDEPSRSSSDSDVTLFEEADVPGVNEPEVTEPDDSLLAHISRTPSPMRKATTKLAAWFWAREQEQGEDSDSHSVPLMATDHDVRHMPSSRVTPPVEVEDPPAPPNTAKTSGASSARHSGPQSPYEDDDIAQDTIEEGVEEVERDRHDEEGDSPIELRFRSTLSRVRSMPPSADYLAVPSNSLGLPTSPGGARFSRQLSNLAAEDEHFQGHRDSVDLYHRREREEELNNQLMATRDSFVLAKTKYDHKHPKVGGGGTAIQYSRFGGLSPIMDASPPESRIQLGLQSMSKLATEAKKMRAEEAHPEEHVGCAIYEVERPRWFEANCKRATV